MAEIYSAEEGDVVGHGKAPPCQAGKRRGVKRERALAVYFADEDGWRAWIGDESTPAFVGRAGTAKVFTGSGARHTAKAAFLDLARATADAALAARKKVAPPGQPPAPAQRLALQAGASLDGLIARLGQK